MDVDEARLRPHLRQQQPTLIVAPDNGTTHVQTFNAPSQPRAKTNDDVMVDPRELRGIPVVGRNVGGVSPGTQPERATINKISREEGRAA
jgi:hypothetical protein